MSREIKFRIWDNEKHEVMTVQSPRKWTVDCTVEQYTGLKDKNGKEIYEGDILWWEHYYGMTGNLEAYSARVCWEETYASFVVGDGLALLGHIVDEDEVEIIGNIHETPELLEGEDGRQN